MTNFLVLISISFLLAQVIALSDNVVGSPCTTNSECARMFEYAGVCQNIVSESQPTCQKQIYSQSWTGQITDTTIDTFFACSDKQQPLSWADQQQIINLKPTKPTPKPTAAPFSGGGDPAASLVRGLYTLNTAIGFLDKADPRSIKLTVDFGNGPVMLYTGILNTMTTGTLTYAFADDETYPFTYDRFAREIIIGPDWRFQRIDSRLELSADSEADAAVAVDVADSASDVELESDAADHETDETYDAQSLQYLNGWHLSNYQQALKELSWAKSKNRVYGSYDEAQRAKYSYTWDFYAGKFVENANPPQASPKAPIGAKCALNWHCESSVCAYFDGETSMYCVPASYAGAFMACKFNSY